MSDKFALNPESDRGARVIEIRDQIARPALQQTLKTAKDKGHDEKDILNGVSAAYQQMLIAVLGPKGAAALMKGHAEFLAEAAEKAEAATKN